MRAGFRSGGRKRSAALPRWAGQTRSRVVHCAQVPFKPTGSRSVYFRECLALNRSVGYR